MWPIMRMTRGILLLLLLQTLTGWTVSQSRQGAPVRLVNSNSSCSGRLEIFRNGQWGTVCDNGWGLNDAKVVCRQLGCGEALSAPKKAHFGQGSGPIWVDNLQCSGHESSITDCKYQGPEFHKCGHKDDAGVVCEDINTTVTVSTTTPAPTPPVTVSTTTPAPTPPVTVSTTTPAPTPPVTVSTTTPAPTPPSSPVRLVNSNSSCSGRLEIFQNGQWGTVCDNGWGLNDVKVVCRQLGCGKALSAPKKAHFGQGSGPIWVDNLQCSGHESSITDCKYQGPEFHKCGHKDDAGVVCEDIDTTVTVSTTTAPPPSSPVRLVNSNSRCSGRLEIFHNGKWGTVCDNGWGLNDAKVVCRQLGCGKALSVNKRARFGKGCGPIWLDNVQCSGNESSLTDCPHQGSVSNKCHHGVDASVICEDEQRLLQASQLVCSRNQLEVGVRLGSMGSSGLNMFAGHLAAPYCSSYKVRDNIVWYQVARQAGICGTVLTTNDTHATYSNCLFFYPPSDGSLVPPEIVPFSCAYPLETNTSLNAAIEPQMIHGGGLSGSGAKASADMYLFCNSNFDESYPEGPVTLPMGSALHVGVSVAEIDPSFVAVLEDCYTTPSSNPDDPIRYLLIHSRCPADPRHVSVVENGLSLRARFSGLVFPFQGENPSIFLHCRLRLCDKRSQNCAPSCKRRARRSVTVDTQLDLLTLGPITWGVDKVVD